MQSIGQRNDLGLQYILNEQNIDGCILIYDLEENDYYTNSKQRMRKWHTPGSMFHLFNTLMFYQLGIVKDTTQALDWDQEVHEFDNKEISNWNKDTYLAEAFRNGTDWYFNELSKDIEHKLYKKKVKKSKYGRISSSRLANQDFWNGGSGKVTINMKDQIKFLRRFRDYKVPFEKGVVDIVKDLMLESETPNHTLFGKIGLFKDNNLFDKGGEDIGWYSGYVETKDNTYFFISYISKDFKDDREDFFELRKRVVFKALKHLFGLDME